MQLLNSRNVSPAYGFSALALVKCSNEECPGPRHNTKEDPGTSSLVMKGEHGQEVSCDPGQVTATFALNGRSMAGQYHKTGEWQAGTGQESI